MNRARIVGTEEIVKADVLLELYPNYNELEFECIDQKCSVRMAPSCIKKMDRRKPHFKKYRNREHVATCEYAVVDNLYNEGKNKKLDNIQLNKIGYPSVFKLNEINKDLKDLSVSQSKIGNEDEGVTGNGGVSKVYEFDADNIKFDRKNSVQSIDRIVDWYLGFPYNRDVEIEINGIKIPYRYFFKGITDYTDPASLKNERIFYSRVMLSEKNREVFSEYKDSVFINLLAFKDKDELNNKFSNYSVKIDKKLLSKNILSRMINRYNALFDEAFTEFKNKSVEPNVGLYIFAYGTIDEHNDTLLNVKQNHITFRYDEVRKTQNEDKM